MVPLRGPGLIRLVALGVASMPFGCQPEPIRAPAGPTVSSAAASVSLPATAAIRPSQPSSARVPVGSDDAVRGTPAAPVTVVAFLDFQCPFCARAWLLLRALEERFDLSHLRLVVKHCPLPNHELALPAALASQIVLELRGPEAFWQFADRVFSQHGELSAVRLRRLAVSLGVAGDEYDRRLGEPGGSARQKVQADLDLASVLEVRGTPHFLVNGQALSGTPPFPVLAARVAAELGAAAALAERGVPAHEVYAARVAANANAVTQAEKADDQAAAPDSTDAESADSEETAAWPVPLRGAPVRGPRDALVTIVEFADFECPFCARVQKTVDELLRRYPRDVRLAYKHFLLESHRRARPAAMLALLARAKRGDPGFFSAAAALYERPGALDDAELQEVGRRLGLGAAEVNRALTTNPYQAALDADVEQADELEVEGTPHFFINGRRLGGARPLAEFVRVVDAELGKARALVAGGVPRARVYEAVVRGATGPAPEKRTVSPPTAASPTRGRADAPIEIQVFADFECPYCRRGQATLAELERAHPGQIRVVWRNLPLAGHPHARLSACAALEAFAERGNPGFWAMHDWLFGAQDRPDGLERSALEEYARRVGLDVRRFRQALGDGRHDAAVRADETAAVVAGIEATPAYLINGYLVSGAPTLSALERVVNHALGKGGR